MLKKSWAKYLLCKMNFVKHKATTKCKVDVKNFEQIKGESLITIKAVVMFKDIPYELIINWDQTGIRPGSTVYQLVSGPWQSSVGVEGK